MREQTVERATRFSDMEALSHGRSETAPELRHPQGERPNYHRPWQLGRLFDGLAGQEGNAFIEYFVLAFIVMVATIAFYDHGNFGGSHGAIDNMFNQLVNKIAPPTQGGGGGRQHHCPPEPMCACLHPPICF